MRPIGQADRRETNGVSLDQLRIFKRLKSRQEKVTAEKHIDSTEYL